MLSRGRFLGCFSTPEGVRLRLRGRDLKGRWPLRVKSDVLTVSRLLPVYPDQRTFSEPIGMSQRCHLQTIGVSEKPPSRKPQRYAAQLPDESD
jgi:hypothetical protein